jgi:hypothetical protein
MSTTKYEKSSTMSTTKYEKSSTPPSGVVSTVSEIPSTTVMIKPSMLDRQPDQGPGQDKAKDRDMETRTDKSSSIRDLQSTKVSTPAETLRLKKNSTMTQYSTRGLIINKPTRQKLENRTKFPLKAGTAVPTNKEESVAGVTTSTPQVEVMYMTTSKKFSTAAFNRALQNNPAKVKKAVRKHKIIPLGKDPLAKKYPSNRTEMSKKNAANKTSVSIVSAPSQEFRLNGSLAKDNLNKPAPSFDDSDKISLLNETTRKNIYTMFFKGNFSPD